MCLLNKAALCVNVLGFWFVMIFESNHMKNKMHSSILFAVLNAHAVVVGIQSTYLSEGASPFAGLSYLCTCGRWCR